VALLVVEEAVNVSVGFAHVISVGDAILAVGGTPVLVTRADALEVQPLVMSVTVTV